MVERLKRLSIRDRWESFFALLAMCLITKTAAGCRFQVPEHEISKLVRQYPPIITGFIENEKEMEMFEK